LLFSNILVCADVSAHPSSCLRHLVSQYHQPQARLLSNEIMRKADALVPDSGTGLIRIQSANYFSEPYIQLLFENMPPVNRLHLISGHKISVDEIAKKHPLFDRSLLQPILDYANLIVDSLNSNLATRERGNLGIEALSLARSDGHQLQIDNTWHIDSSRYLTSVTNLMGEGTIYDASGPHPHLQSAYGWEEDPPSQERTLDEGSAMIYNGAVRYILFEGPGTMPLAHRAPDGRKPRLGIILFIAPKNMIAQNIVVRSMGKDPDALESLRQSVFREFFGNH